MKTVDKFGPNQTDSFYQGTETAAYRIFGSHRTDEDTWRFSLWAPNAQAVSVVGDFNGWDTQINPMSREADGIWRLSVKGLNPNTLYKYAINTSDGWGMSSDPYAFHEEARTGGASMLHEIKSAYDWTDSEWLRKRESLKTHHCPVSIYEADLSAWGKDARGNTHTYRTLAQEMIPYVKEMGFTHIQIASVMDNAPGALGAKPAGYFSPQAMFGEPEGLMAFVDAAHNAQIGVLFTWTPGYFPRDPNGLFKFDATPLYEHPDPRRGENRELGICVFDYGKPEVRSFLLSSAMFWLREYHADGLRVDAISSMLYNDYCREENDRITNKYNGNENIEAFGFLRELCERINEDFPGVFLSAQDTPCPVVTYPTYLGGLGIDYTNSEKWPHDTIAYMQMDPVYRKYHHEKITFSLHGPLNEHNILSIPRQVAAGCAESPLEAMHGDEWRKFASLRTVYGYMFAHPGKKQMFMGCEFGKFIQWNFGKSLDWQLMPYGRHAQFQLFVKDLNAFYKRSRSLWRSEGKDSFEWVSANDTDNSILAFIRGKGRDKILVVVNFTPTLWEKYRFGLPKPGVLYELFNTDALKYYGSGKGNPEPVETVREPWNGNEYSVTITVPALSAMFMRYSMN